MMMVVAPTVLVPEVPATAPAEGDASGRELTAITPTAASSAYEWNPTAAGMSGPRRATAGPIGDAASMGNANIPLLASPGLFGGPLTGSGGGLGSGVDRSFYDYDYFQGPNNFGTGPFRSSPLGVSSRASGADSTFARTFSTPSSVDSPPGDLPNPAVAVPEPASILATITGLGLVAATAARLRRRPRRARSLDA